MAVDDGSTDIPIKSEAVLYRLPNGTVLQVWAENGTLNIRANNGTLAVEPTCANEIRIHGVVDEFFRAVRQR